MREDTRSDERAKPATVEDLRQDVKAARDTVKRRKKRREDLKQRGGDHDDLTMANRRLEEARKTRAVAADALRSIKRDGGRSSECIS